MRRAPVLLSAVALAFLVPAASAQHVLLTVDGQTAGDLLGRTVDAIGDVNGDGVPDVIAGAPFASPNQPQSGYVVLLDGATGATLLTVPGAQNGSMLGASVAAAGDMDLDGFPDFIAGAPLVLPPLPGGPPNPPGQAFVYTRIGAALHVFASPNIGDGFGRSVDGGGDVNMDGIPDVIVGSDFGNFAQVFSGLDGSVLHTFPGDTAGDFFGYAVAMPGDTNGDGAADLLVGARLDDNNGADSGTARLLSGATGATLATFVGDGAGDGLGYAVAGAGDVDGDGRPDLIAGARGDDDGGAEAGSARVWSGATFAVLHTLHGEAAGDGAGNTNGVDGAGDVDGDGRADLIVASALHDANGTSSGRIRVLSGATGATLGAFDGDGADFILGVAARGGQDYDGDGRPDVVMGAFGDDLVGGANSGHVRVGSVCAVAAWQNYGAGWPGTQGVPSLVATGDPVLGASLTIQLGNSAGVATQGYLLLGPAAVQVPTALGGTLLVQVVPAFAFPLPIPAGGLLLSGTLPNQPALCGVPVFLQAIEGDAGASHGASFTPGLELLLGS